MAGASCGYYANAEEVTQYVVSPQYLKGQSLHFALNDTIGRDTALEQLVTMDMSG